MHVDSNYFWLLVGMGLVTFVPRWAPLLFLSRRRLPFWFTEWLEMIPAAILSALLAPELLTGGTPRSFDVWRPELLAAIPTFAVAIKTRSLSLTVVVGMASYGLIQYFF
jgi:branched-subunit amino acid transport protein